MRSDGYNRRKTHPVCGCGRPATNNVQCADNAKCDRCAEIEAKVKLQRHTCGVPRYEEPSRLPWPKSSYLEMLIALRNWEKQNGL